MGANVKAKQQNKNKTQKKRTFNRLQEKKSQFACKQLHENASCQRVNILTITLTTGRGAKASWRDSRRRGARLLKF